MSSLHDRLDADYATARRPNPGDKLVGVITGITEYDAGHGKYPIITVREPDGDEFAVHAFHTVLQNELAQARPKVGEIVGIKYAGKREGKAGATYHGYKVTVDRGEPAGIEWAKRTASRWMRRGSSCGSASPVRGLAKWRRTDDTDPCRASRRRRREASVCVTPIEAPRIATLTDPFMFR